MFNFIKNKKVRHLREKFLSGQIDRATFLAELYDISVDDWKNSLTKEEFEIYELTGKFNRNEITINEYKEKIKPLDKEKWLKLATKDELFLNDLETKFNNKEITENEYQKEVATFNKESYINFANVEFDVGEKGRHALELDWNSFFIDELKKMGYTGQTEEEIVDKWFVAFCANIAAESDAVIVSEPADLRKVNPSQESED